MASILCGWSDVPGLTLGEVVHWEKPLRRQTHPDSPQQEEEPWPVKMPEVREEEGR